MQTRGKFLTVEGTEGVGKSTNMAFIANLLRSHGIDVMVTREPGGTPLAEDLRALLLKKRNELFDPTAELLTVFAARAQHVNTVIVPALNAGRWVLSDRFTDATYAYQGGGRQLDMALISTLEQLVQGDLRPDCTFLLDIDVEAGIKRASQRAELDRFEEEKIAFFERVRKTYLERANASPDAYRVIDAGKGLSQVQSDIAQQLNALLMETQ